MINSVLKRFLKGMIAGAIGSMILLTWQQPTMWVDFLVVLNNLGIAGVNGALIGLLLAIQKWASWETEVK